MSKLGDWTGQAAEFEMVELKGDDEGYVVVLQSGDRGAARRDPRRGEDAGRL